MRLFVVFSTLAALLLSASLHLGRVLPMPDMAHLSCGDGIGCIDASTSPLADCLDHCLKEQAPPSPAMPIVVGWSVVILFVCFTLLDSQELMAGDAFRVGRDASFGKYDLHKRWASVMIKS